MKVNDKNWKLTILENDFPSVKLDGLAVGDINGDGKAEVVVGGFSSLSWYCPSDYRKGLITEGNSFSVGMAACDIDNDGIDEIFVSEHDKEKQQWMLTCYKYNSNLENSWTKIYIDSACSGLAHDIVCVDIDGDGQKEVLVNSLFDYKNGIYIYKMKDGIDGEWGKYIVFEDIFTEGLTAGDLDGDGRLEIVSGPDWYKMPEEGAYSGKWTRKTFAPDLREMCKVELFDITGNGRPDIIITDSEYFDGKLCWFENRLLENPDETWVEHCLEELLIFSHSLDVTYNDNTKNIEIIVAEMQHGGFGAPYNHDARVMMFMTSDNGKTWNKKHISIGEVTHQAKYIDVDGDGVREIIGKTWRTSKLQMWKLDNSKSNVIETKHSYIDRDKPETATDIYEVDITGDGKTDVVCGKWWYKGPSWERFEIPGIAQVFNVYDIDGDGRDEIIAIKYKVSNPYMGRSETKGFYETWSSVMCWMKPIDPGNGVWEEHPIGKGNGDWPHGSLIAPVLPGGKLALMVAYHNFADGFYPEIFEVPDKFDNKAWKKSVLAKIPYGEVMYANDITGNGLLDIFAGGWWLENKGDGTFEPHVIAENFDAARITILDVNGDGRMDVVLSEHTIQPKTAMLPFSKVVWCEQPKDPINDPWIMHTIDKLRCVHSMDSGDIDGDGEIEIICA